MRRVFLCVLRDVAFVSRYHLGCPPFRQLIVSILPFLALVSEKILPSGWVVFFCEALVLPHPPLLRGPLGGGGLHGGGGDLGLGSGAD
eukprot:7388336-Prymnesium_polylepis.1